MLTIETTASWRRVFIAIVMLVSLPTIGCSSHPTLNELDGRYESRRSFGTEVLTLRPDGTFLQVINVAGRGNPLSCEGKWTYDPVQGSVGLYGAIVTDDGFGQLPEDLSPDMGRWGLVARTGFGGLVLSWNPDHDLLFRKTGSGLEAENGG